MKQICYQLIVSSLNDVEKDKSITFHNFSKSVSKWPNENRIIITVSLMF